MSGKRVDGVMDAEIGRRLRARRLELGLSQEKVGDLVGLTFQQVQKYEKGTNRISTSRLVQLADAMKTDFDYFVDGLVKAATKKPTDFAKFLATRDGAKIVEAMIKIPESQRQLVIDLAQGLAR